MISNTMKNSFQQNLRYNRAVLYKNICCCVTFLKRDQYRKNVFGGIIPVNVPPTGRGAEDQL